MNKIRRIIRLWIVLLMASIAFSGPLGAQTINQAWQAFENKDYRKAQQIFEELALRGDIDAEYGLGYIYWRGPLDNRNMQQALDWLTKSAQKGHIGAQIGLGYIYLYGVAGQVDLVKAEYWYQQSIELGSSDGYNGVAYVWAIQGKNLQQALEYIDIALAFDDHDAEKLDTKGWILHQMGQYEQAFDFICKAVLGKPGDPELRLHLGDVYWALGLGEKAQQEWLQGISFAEMRHLMTDESKEYVDGQGLKNWREMLEERLQRTMPGQDIAVEASRYSCLQPIS